MDALEGPITMTVFGWATKCPTAPRRHDLFWLDDKGNVYAWDGDETGWVRIKPPERVPHDGKDLPHG